LFVGGVMNLIWIAGLAVYAWIEKSLSTGRWLSRVAGVAMIVSGIAICSL
jgi:predicted metal-binding membrane protein